MPIVGTVLYSRSPSGLGIFTAGIILAFMIVPFIASITRDMLEQIPSVLRESAYGIGATTWEVVRHVLVPQAIDPIHWQVRDFALVHGVAGRGEYQVLKSWSLAGGSGTDSPTG